MMTVKAIFSLGIPDEILKKEPGCILLERVPFNERPACYLSGYQKRVTKIGRLLAK